ncbi:MAG: WD40/YVTN/BNR-like repeat-containing protein, partial [Chloroflexota bacterium]
ASLQRDRPREADPPLGGVARSDDGGKTWRKFFSDYTRAVIVPRANTDAVLTGPAPQVGAGGRIEVSYDGGDTWQDASNGISTPMDDMVEVFVESPDQRIWAICSGGRLLSSAPQEWRWETIVDPADAGVRVESASFVSGSS